MRPAARLSRAAAAPLVALGVLVGLLAGAAPAGARAATTCDSTWFGPALDIETDMPSAYAERLGADPSLYTFPADYPLTQEGVDQLGRFAAEVAAQGAVLVLQVEPTVPLKTLTPADADRLATEVADLHDRLDTRVLVRFAPEMNGSWRPWGQQPEAFTAAFRAVADAVHATATDASMVWSPVYGSGYPFAREQGTDSEIDLSATRRLAPLDTDGNGRLDSSDDPYGPYYPGDEAVDWVGLFLYRFGQSQGVDRNVRPPADEVASRLAEEWGYPATGRASFYDRFAEGHDKPLLLETAALDNPAVGGATELALKQQWWSEILAALPDHPRICGISWLELERVEPEVADQPVDWSATRTSALAAALLTDLRQSGVTLGPVTEAHEQATPPPSRPASRPSSSGLAVDRPPGSSLLPVIVPTSVGDAGTRGAAVALVVLLALALAGGRRPRWRYHQGAGRDRRLDALRGLLLVGMVAWQLPVRGPLHDVADAGGAVGGLETFLLASGAAVGLTYPPLAAQLGHTAALGRRSRRAMLVWLAALAGVLLTYVLGLLPGLDLDAVGAVGPSYDLYGQARHLFDYPPPGSVGRAYLFLEMGAWILLPLALFVALLVLSPLAAGPLQRGWWWAVLPVSWAVYALGRATGAELLPSLSEEFAPLLIWQVLFVHGIALGRYRSEISRLLARPIGAALLALVVVGAAAVLGTGEGSSGASAQLPLPRVLVVTAATLVVLLALTACWWLVAPVSRAVLEPLGRAPLYVVLAHAGLVLLVGSASSLNDGPWAGTAVSLTCLGVLVLLARWRAPAGAD